MTVTQDECEKIMTHFKSLSALLICLLPFTAPMAFADDFGAKPDKVSVQAVRNLEAYAAFKMGQYDKARDMWEQLAAEGNTTAMVNLSNMFEQGQGSIKNPVEALEWTKRAAQSGDTRAQVDLGWHYERGNGVERDIHQAAFWFRQAAQQGDRDGAFNLGIMLATDYGNGTQSASADETSEARQWLTQAAEAGNGEAAAYLKVLADPN